MRFFLIALIFLFGLTLKADVLPINWGITGAFFDPVTSGQGVYLNLSDGSGTKQLIVTWYTFHPDPAEEGSLLWMTAVAPIDSNQRLHDLPVYLQEGGGFNTPVTENPSTAERVGTLTISIESCNEILLSWDLDYMNSARGGRGRIVTQGNQIYQRLTSVPRDNNNNLLCN